MIDALPGQKTRTPSTPPSPLNPGARIWCAWRQEMRAKGRRTKIPYAGIRRKAESNNSATWIKHQEAQDIMAHRSFFGGAVDGVAGIGVFLGANTVPGLVLCGADLDTCLDPERGALTPWAQAVLDAVPSYAETSPSGTGIKVFFCLTPDDATRVQAVLRKSSSTGSGAGKSWKLPGSNHPPGIELYLEGRYFALTGKLWPGAPPDIRTVGAENVLRIVHEIGPSLKPDAGKLTAKPKPRAKANGVHTGADADYGTDIAGAQKRLAAWSALNPKCARLLEGDLSGLGADKSASVVAWHLAGFCKDAGLSQPETRGVVRGYAHVDLSWYSDDERQWSRIWEPVRNFDALIVDDGGDAGGDQRPPLPINEGDYTQTADAIVALLAKSPRLFFRNGPVTLARDPLHGTLEAHLLTAHGVTREAHKAARPYEPNGKGPKFKTLPERVASLALDDKDAWRDLRPLDGFASAPLLHADGTIRTAEGYDPTSRMFCTSTPDVMVPERPSRASAETALLKLRAFLRTCAFEDAQTVDEAFIDDKGRNCTARVVDVAKPPAQDESAALHALLTAVCRPSLLLAPALVVTSASISGAGAGKGLLARVICAIAFGQAPKATTRGHDNQELDKRIVGALIKASQVLFLDNLNGRTLQSDTLASAITERPAQLRGLGKSDLVTIAAASFIVVTGNGLSISEDMARRVLHVSLDPGVEDPEGREFPLWRPEAQSKSLLKEAFSHRAEFLTAALTIWRWGRQSREIKPGRAMGSFEQWCEWVRDPLVNLGCADPAERIAQIKQLDPHRAAVAELFGKWVEHHGDKPVAVSDLHQEVRDVANPDGRSRQYLAAKIRKMAGTRASGYVLIHSPAVGKWGQDKYTLRPTQGGQAIGGIGGIGSSGGPTPPMPPMAPMPLVTSKPENGADFQEGEL